MNTAASLSSRFPGEPGAVPAMGLEASRLRDAGWKPAARNGETLAEPGRTQLLHHWTLSPGQRTAGLLFQPLDGNPRHGVLALFVDQGELHGAIEILERQGRWLVMPDGLRARTLAVSMLAHAAGQPTQHARTASTPDRRFVFFNAPRDGGSATLVERRHDTGPLHR